MVGPETQPGSGNSQTTLPLALIQPRRYWTAMSLRSYRVTVGVDVVARAATGYPLRSPVHAAVNPEGQGWGVHAGANHGNYARDCAIALARACRGIVYDAKGRLVDDATTGPAMTWSDLVAAWDQIDADLVASDERKRLVALRKWKKEVGNDPEVPLANDWSDVL